MKTPVDLHLSFLFRTTRSKMSDFSSFNECGCDNCNPTPGPDCIFPRVSAMEASS